MAWRPRRNLRFRLHIERREERDLASRSEARETSHLSSPRHFLRRPPFLGHSPAPAGSEPPSRTQRYDPTCPLPVGDSWAVGCCAPVPCSSSPSCFFCYCFFSRYSCVICLQKFSCDAVGFLGVCRLGLEFVRGI